MDLVLKGIIFEELLLVNVYKITGCKMDRKRDNAVARQRVLKTSVANTLFQNICSYNA